MMGRVAEGRDGGGALTDSCAGTHARASHRMWGDGGVEAPLSPPLRFVTPRPRHDRNPCVGHISHGEARNSGNGAPRPAHRPKVKHNGGLTQALLLLLLARGKGEQWLWVGPATSDELPGDRPPGV